MKRYLFLLIFLGFFIIQLGCTSKRLIFHNKIVVYSSEASPGQVTPNSAFIDFYQDTINKIDYPFSLFENDPGLQKANNSEKLLPNVYPFSGIPFKISREKRDIYINYTFKNEVFKRKYFKISDHDTVQTSSFDYLCDANTSYNWVTTKFTGDTVIKVLSKKIRCWVFKVEYPNLFSPNKRSEIIYLDKRSLLPIQINTIYHRPDKDNKAIIWDEVYINKVDSVFVRPWNESNKKWNYPKCWESGHSSLN